ncbi:MAG: hypothetical protein SFW09_15020 [Hyphomicrobiaceae bacterium]|nr:hypothetical protein [Hyphomicrobiaceae bacterium]
MQMRLSRQRCRATAAIAVVWVTATLAAVVPARADCGYEGVVVNGTSAERDGACRALGEVLGYFTEMGFQVAPKVRITFRPAVYVDVFAPGADRPSGKQRVSGYYDSGREVIELTAATAAKGGERRPWRQEWCSDICFSIAHHEIAHMLVDRIMGQRYEKLARAWREYIASAIQFDLMPAELRERIMSRFPNHPAFAMPEHVNELTYGFDPDGFAISSFLHMKANGGKQFIGQIVRGGAAFPTGELFWSR